MENVGVPHTSDDGSTTYYDYEIKLDQNFGYPTHIASYKRVTRPSREITWREKTQEATDVIAFKVLR